MDHLAASAAAAATTAPAVDVAVSMSKKVFSFGGDDPSVGARGQPTAAACSTAGSGVVSASSRGPTADLSDLPAVSVTTLEAAGGRYGLYTWPSAVVLARYIWHHRGHVAGTTVIELGAGTALPGLLAAKLGAARVYLTDRAAAMQVLDHCQRAVALNNLGGDSLHGGIGSCSPTSPATTVKVLGLTWGHFPEEIIALPAADWILGADVFYEPTEFEDCIATVAFLLRQSVANSDRGQTDGSARPGPARFITAYQNRSPDRSLETLLQHWGLVATEHLLRSFYPLTLQHETEFDNDSIHLLEITMK